MRMNSGAVHDACMLADIVPVGMIFVPSINGRSHVPEEYTRYEDIKKGCDVLLGTVIKMAE
jgi:allantoate deiminase